MIVDACPQRRIKEEGNQVKFRKQLNESLLSLAMSPTKCGDKSTPKADDFR